jgi:hypothetical protein
MFSCLDDAASRHAAAALSSLNATSKPAVSQLAAGPHGCLGGHWCKKYTSPHKMILASERFPSFLVRLALSPAGTKELEEEGELFRALCSRTENSIAHRLPWTGTSKTISEGVALYPQLRLGGKWFRVRDGTRFYAVMVRTLVRARNRSGADGIHAVGRQMLADLLLWEAFVRGERLLLEDLQFIMSRDGQIWLLDVRGGESREGRDGAILHDPLAAWALARPTGGADNGGPDIRSHDLSIAYAVRRERASLLSFALAVGAVLHDLVVRQAGTKSHMAPFPQLQHLLCHDAICELGCALSRTPPSLRHSLPADPKLSTLLRDAISRYDELTTMTFGGTQRSWHELLPLSNRTYSLGYTTPGGERCGACRLPASVINVALDPRDPPELENDYGKLTCLVDGGEAYLGMERALLCAYKGDDTSTMCRLRLARCRATPGCPEWLDTIKQLSHEGRREWMHLFYGPGEPLRRRWPTT